MLQILTAKTREDRSADCRSTVERKLLEHGLLSTQIFFLQSSYITENAV